MEEKNIHIILAVAKGFDISMTAGDVFRLAKQGNIVLEEISSPRYISDQVWFYMVFDIKIKQSELEGFCRHFKNITPAAYQEQFNFAHKLWNNS